MLVRFFKILCFLVISSSSLLSSPTDALFLTWINDPTTSMTVVWVTKDPEITPEIEFRLASTDSWTPKSGVKKDLPNHTGNQHYQVDLNGLSPDSHYEFRLKNYPSETFKFHTAPTKINSSLDFIVGGDVYHGRETVVARMHRAASSRNPLFAIVGGDLSYATDRIGNKKEDEGRWITFLKLWHSGMKTHAGDLIPIIPAIGNHEVIGRNNQTPDQAPYFYALFPTPGKQGYSAVDFGNYLSVILLDSGHTHPIQGAQTDWLRSTLEQRKNIPTKIATYHVPAYPSYRKLPKQTVLIREHWLPLFDEFNLAASFENHEHCFKRSYPLKGGKIDPQGTLYLGDGAWGVKPRRVGTKGFDPKHDKNALWYIAKAGSIRHVWHVRLEDGKRTYMAIDERGTLFDRVEQLRD